MGTPWELDSAFHPRATIPIQPGISRARPSSSRRPLLPTQAPKHPSAPTQAHPPTRPHPTKKKLKKKLDTFVFRAYSAPNDAMRQSPHSLRLTTEEKRENSRAEPTHQSQTTIQNEWSTHHVRIEHFFPTFGASLHNHDFNRDCLKRRNRFFWRPEGAPLQQNPF